MPMDIRNFFAQKGSGSGGGGDDGDKKKKGKSTSASSSSGNKKKAAAKPSKSAASSMLSPIDEGRASSKRNSNNKPKAKKIVFDDSDNDSDATTDSPVDVDSKPKAIGRGKAAAASKTKANLKEVSAEDFFGSSSPSTSKRKASPAKKKKKVITLDDDDDDDDTDMEDNNIDDNDIDLDKELPIISKKRPSPQKVAKNPPSKPVRQLSPLVKRQKIEPTSTLSGEDNNDEEMKDAKKNKKNKDDDDDEDEDFVEDSKKDDSDDDDDDDDDDDFEAPVARKTRSSPRKRTPAAVKKEATPPSTQKKRKAATTPKAKAKATPPAKKEPTLEPTLELASFDTDRAVPECLQGSTFVFTGVLEGGLSRDDAQDYVKILGGRVTGSVSTKTTYLVVGPVLEDGRPYEEGKKYQKAVELGTHIVLGEKKLYGLAKLCSDRAKANMPAAAPVVLEASSPDAVKTEKVDCKTDVKTEPAGTAATAAVSNPYAKKVVNNPYAKKAGAISNPYAKKAAGNNPYAKKAVGGGGAAAGNAAVSLRPVQHETNALWVDKHAPQSTNQILGNKDSVNKLAAWLARWESRFNNSKAVGKSFTDSKGPLKAVLISGPPGIGKTTTASLVAREAGRDLLEFNASDVRSKKAMHEGMGDITGSKSVQAYFQQGGQGGGGNPNVHQKRVIVMDEVDGMGGGDRGGMSELIQMIKHSHVPIICICNDRNSQKIKSLLQYCLDLKFKRPMKGQIAKTAIRIAQLEGMHVEQNAAEAMAESCGNDIRQVVNALQMWASDGGKKDVDNSLTYKGLKERESSINKDAILRVGLFDATKQILEGRKGLAGADPKAELSSFFKRTDAFFVDYSFTGLMVQQNYLKVMNSQFNALKREKDEQKSLEFLDRVHSAAATMSDYAMVENKIRGGSDMNWSLLPFSSVLAVKTGFHCSGPDGAMYPGFPEFSSWLARNSTKGKKTRIMQELNHHMNYKVSGGTSEIRLSYVPFLRDRFLNQLKISKDEDRNAVAIQLMDDYGLDRDDVFENLDEFKMGLTGPKIADIDSKAKAAFTREYNKGSHKSQALVEEQGAPKKKKGGATSADSGDPDAINDDVEDDDDDDDEEDLEKLKAAFKKKGRAKKAPAKTKKAPAKKKK